ncbi:MAG TPA: aliphatic sulfonate ABC transporter substrate-binding protein, partial [Burkholderiales bacterium]|nr:aliphatic sulfonate ABC transporter substrate-binding protein [Burkholderiales bacterium]
MTLNKTVRRSLLKVLLAFGALAVSQNPALAEEQLRIGYQKYGTFILLKGKGTLEKRLAPLGIYVRWTEFPAGPQLLEGLNLGAIDVGHAGEAPPIFAQAAGADLVYIGHEPPAPAGEAILVQKDSSIKKISDLKGKRIALNKGSNVHYLLVKALEKNGIDYKDVQVAFLPPADARAAFERGSVEAWVIWDPFQAAAEKQLGARVLVDAKGLAANHQFYLASRTYAQRRADVVKIVLEEVAKVDEWSKQNLKEVAGILGTAAGLDPAVAQLS